MIKYTPNKDPKPFDKEKEVRRISRMAVSDRDAALVEALGKIHGYEQILDKLVPAMNALSQETAWLADTIDTDDMNYEFTKPE